MLTAHLLYGVKGLQITNARGSSGCNVLVPGGQEHRNRMQFSNNFTSYSTLFQIPPEIRGAVSKQTLIKVKNTWGIWDHPCPCWICSYTVVWLLYGLCEECEGETLKLCKSAFGFHFSNISNCVFFCQKIQVMFYWSQRFMGHSHPIFLAPFQHARVFFSLLLLHFSFESAVGKWTKPNKGLTCHFLSKASPRCLNE